MPNWCYNRLEVSAPEEDAEAQLQLDDFVHGLTADPADGGSVSILKTYVPRPEDIGAGWYDWSVQNWGTKWEDEMRWLDDPSDGPITLGGDTAWAPPLQGIVTVSGKFPLLTFVLGWNEPGMCFLGAARIQAGEYTIKEVFGDAYPAWVDDDDDAYVTDEAYEMMLDLMTKVA